MTNFSFLNEFPQFAELATYCEDAEAFALSKPNLSAISARNAIEFVIKYIYKAKVGSLPIRANPTFADSLIIMKPMPMI